MDSLIRWLKLRLLKWLAATLDPESAARAKELQGRIAQAEAEVGVALEQQKRLEALREQSAHRQAELDAEIAALDEQRGESLKRLADINTQIKQVDGELVEAKKRLDGLSDSDRVRVDL